MSRRNRRVEPYWPHSDPGLTTEHPQDGPQRPPGDDETPGPTCCACERELGPYEPLTCAHCQDHARSAIGHILGLYTTLPDHIGHLTGTTGGHIREKSPSPPLPGGDALVLMSAGSYGWSDNGETTRDDDPQSVAQVFAAWEDRWRRHRKEPAASTTATVKSTTGYVLGHLQWAANTDPAFATFLTEIRHLRSRLRVVTGVISPPVKSDAYCLNGDCGGRLEQRWRDDGLDDMRSCPDCRQEYTPAQYAQALKTQLQLRRESA